MAERKSKSAGDTTVLNRRRLADGLVAGVKLDSTLYDVYEGTKDLLIAQGLADDGQFPGDVQCRRKTMATYAPDGTRIPQGGNEKSKDAGAYQIHRVGKRFRITVTPEEGELERRRAAWRAKHDAKRAASSDLAFLHDAPKQPAPTGLEALQAADVALAIAESNLLRARQFREAIASGLHADPGLAEAAKLLETSIARFQPGDIAMFCSDFIDDARDGAQVALTSGFHFARVRSDDGPYLATNGKRVAYQWGYTGLRAGATKEAFYAARHLRSLDGSPRHIRLVS